MKRSMLVLAACGCLLALGGETLLAQKGAGRMGGPGHAQGFPAAATTGMKRSEAGPRQAPRASPVAGANLMKGGGLAGNGQLALRIQPLLPAGMTIATASAGFQNQGQFIAALHVSQNLGISFVQLQAAMTGPHPESLGTAIHSLLPSLARSTVRSNARAAEAQAENDADAAELATRLAANSTLAARAQALLPAGTNLQSAAAGFENLHQFLLTEHVASDLGISFSQLKSDVTGTNPISLKQAVVNLDPSLSSAIIKSDLKTARQQTSVDLQTAGASGDEQAEVAEP